MNWDYFSSARGINTLKFMSAYNIKSIDDFEKVLKSFNVTLTDKNIYDIQLLIDSQAEKVKTKNEQSVRNKTRGSGKTQRKEHNGNSSKARSRRTRTRKTTKHVSKSSNKQGSNKIIQVKSDKNWIIIWYK